MLTSETESIPGATSSCCQCVSSWIVHNLPLEAERGSPALLIRKLPHFILSRRLAGKIYFSLQSHTKRCGLDLLDQHQPGRWLSRCYVHRKSQVWWNVKSIDAVHQALNDLHALFISGLSCPEHRRKSPMNVSCLSPQESPQRITHQKISWLPRDMCPIKVYIIPLQIQGSFDNRSWTNGVKSLVNGCDLCGHTVKQPKDQFARVIISEAEIDPNGFI